MTCPPSEDSDQPEYLPSLHVNSEDSDQPGHPPGHLPSLHAESQDSDQTGRMPRLIWVFAGCTVILLVLSWGGSYFPHFEQSQSKRWGKSEDPQEKTTCPSRGRIFSHEVLMGFKLMGLKLWETKWLEVIVTLMVVVFLPGYLYTLSCLLSKMLEETKWFEVTVTSMVAVFYQLLSNNHASHITLYDLLAIITRFLFTLWD